MKKKTKWYKIEFYTNQPQGAVNRLCAISRDYMIDDLKVSSFPKNKVIAHFNFNNPPHE